MVLIQSLTEQEEALGWCFLVKLESGDLLREIEVHLSWADYNLWSQTGADMPWLVARAALVFVLRFMTVEELPKRLDASIVRRLNRSADAQVPDLIVAEGWCRKG